ncbi:MAG TPA: hypothetical protein VI874_05100, partial [Candidatus Norongarragalinales archaeon]|nr:hypothetical protein [Candidatus Norongarragalinales archaeon]
MRFHIPILALFFLLFAGAQFAARLTFPVSMAVSQGSGITIGNVGPGQTFFVITDPKETSGGKFGLGGAYDLMVASSVPEGWSSKPSKLYANPLQV